ncbi:hypothetical protein [Allofrancisella frigidaquae]|uniref:Uncharacterized protein n=1 Tax=Allofrancisella frigidaquae TaxID=1085644 RepID=A0A6M3HSM2_9GAMM|nr:hypothetical protein [Allofrancisella frigidaquae]QIV94198.1 hypothetical protein E3E15_02025 [Allofrancisella frigidaquae]
MLYTCNSCNYQTVLERNDDFTNCPKCLKGTLTIANAEQISNKYKNEFTKNRSELMRNVAKQAQIPILPGQDFDVFDLHAYQPLLPLLQNPKASQIHWLYPLNKKKVINSNTNFINVVNDDSIYLSVGSGLVSGRETIRLNPQSLELLKAYDNLKQYLVKKINELKPNSPSYVTQVLNSLQVFVCQLLPNNDEKQVDNFILGYYNNRRDPKTHRLLATNGYTSGFVMDLEIFIQNKIGVCRHRNLLSAFLLAKFISEINLTPAMHLQQRYLISEGDIKHLKMIFNIRSKVYQPRGDILDRCSLTNVVSVVGAHTWCIVLLFNQHKEFSGSWIVDAMWEKIFNLSDQDDFKKACSRSTAKNITYDVTNIYKILTKYKAFNNAGQYKIKSQELKPVIAEVTTDESMGNQSYILNHKNPNPLWSMELDKILRPLLQFPNLTSVKEHKLLNELYKKLNLKDFTQTYCCLKTTKADSLIYNEENLGDYQNLFEIIDMCISLMDEHLMKVPF